MNNANEKTKEHSGHVKKDVVIVNLIDWSKSFVDANGTFYCGTTDEQKKNTTRLFEIADLIINNTDLHPITAPEHTINGGLYPAHNAVNPEKFGPEFVYNIDAGGHTRRLGDRTLSPTLTKIIDDAVKNHVKTGQSGIVMPKGVYFQDGIKEPFCRPEDVESTFGENIITSKQFVDGDIKYVIAPKQYFDATRLDSDFDMPSHERIVEVYPELDGRIAINNHNIFNILKKKWPSQNYNLVFINTGVVEGICRLHTSAGLKQMFKFDRVINISDATTPLYGIGLGYETEHQSREACMRVGKDIGVEYMSTDEALKTFKSTK